MRTENGQRRHRFGLSALNISIRLGEVFNSIGPKGQNTGEWITGPY